jgi:hypothetical protein
MVRRVYRRQLPGRKAASHVRANTVTREPTRYMEVGWSRAAEEISSLWRYHERDT